MSSDAEVALAAAEAGAGVISGLYGEPVERFAKSPTDFATVADLEAERVILETIRAARPDDAVLGEESGLNGAPGAGRTWLVDPLCGTLNFAATTPLLAVNVALREPDGVQVAAVADPLAGEVFWTDGASVRLRRDGADLPVGPSTASGLVDVDLDNAHRGRGRFLPAQLVGDPAFRARFGPRVLSTTLALSWVAVGRRAAYLADGDMSDNVHFAAGIALCRAAGCLVTDLEGRPVGTGPGGLIASADRETQIALLAMVDSATPAT
jgi:myo-inositol-1(or 4)-monophosphatase